MKKFLKLFGLIVLCIVILALAFYGYARVDLKQRMETKYDITTESYPLPADTASINAGKHLVFIKGCRDCHGDNLAGKVFNDNVPAGKFIGPNITSGAGGLPTDYSIASWINALRHGINREGHPLFIMPSQETAKMSEEDLMAMIAYLKTVPAIDNEMPVSSPGFMIISLAALHKVNIFSAERIDHALLPTKTADKSTAAKYGEYLAVMCSGCHRENMKGGDPIAPGFPPVPDISASGTVGRWTITEFKTTLRTGVRPNGKAFLTGMPWQMTSHYNDEEISSLYAYLKTL